MLPATLRRRAAAVPSYRIAAMTLFKRVRPIVLFLIAGTLVFLGIVLRKYLWVEARGGRFYIDIMNAFQWGSRANEVGYWNLYDVLGPPDKAISFLPLDYPPGRLAVMTAWVAWTQRTFHGNGSWYGHYSFNAPLLNFNTACALVGAIATALLIGLWIARSRGLVPIRDTRPQFRKWPAESWTWGIVGGSLLWFNPAVLWDAHVWPQWEVWAIAPFLVAALCASLERWWLCGVILGIGILLKGQILLAAPVLILWPLFGGQFAAAGRCVVGAISTVVLFVSPFLVRDAHIVPNYKVLIGAIIFVIAVTAIAVAIMMRKPMRTRFGRASAFYVGSFALTVSLLACPALFGGSLAWFNSGYRYGTYHFQALTLGPVGNLPALLTAHFGWKEPSDLVFGKFTLKTVLAAIYGVCLVLSGLAAAIQSRRGSMRVLLALSAPWILFYAILAQMHDRYLVFAAGITALSAGVGPGYIALHLLLSVIATAPMIGKDGGKFIPQSIAEYLPSIFPDIGYVVLMIAAIFLWTAFSRDRSVAPPQNMPPSPEPMPEPPVTS